MKRLLILFFLSTLLSSTLYSQYRGDLTTKNRRARAAFQRAAEAYEKYHFDLALLHLETALRHDPEFIEAHMIMSDVYLETRKPELAYESLKAAIKINPDFFPANFYNLANVALRLGMYAESMQYYKRYLTFPSLPPAHINVCHANMERAEFGMWAVANPVPFDPVNLGDSVNGPYDEYVNAITPDGSRLYFTLRRPKDEHTINQRNQEEEDFYVCQWLDSLWGGAQKLPPPLNTSGNEGAISVSPDGTFAIFTACYRDDGMGSCDLYYTQRRGNRWSRPLNLGPNVNSPQWDTHASIASDGRTVYFISNRPGGIGGSDIYKTVLMDDGSFSVAQNIGRPLNTEKDEMYPFIHTDNQTLYFSSSGHMGLGGQDFFRSVLGTDGKWSEPVNLGYPINSHMDEVGLIINSSGDLAYFSSNKPGGFGRYDIYSFELPEQHRSTVRVSYMKGYVYDKSTGIPMRARFELIDIESGNTVIQSFSDLVSGDFLVCLPEGRSYALNVQSDGYLFFSDHFDFSGLHTSLEPFVKNIPLQRIGIGETVVLRNIFFDTDQYELKPESVAELTRLHRLLEENSSLRIEIGGHTDNRGGAEHNMVLSENRAKAVVDFLTEKGVEASRLVHKGYGMLSPVDTNDTPEGRANNRRTEFKVISL